LRKTEPNHSPNHAGLAIVMKPAALYARFSDRERQRASSIDDQARVCREAAAEDNAFITDVNIFADPDFRDAEEDRPELERLKSLVREGRCDFTDLYIAETSRLARDSELNAKLRKFFDFYGITLHFVAQGMTSGTSGFVLQHTVQGYVDEIYSTMLGSKVREAAIGSLENDMVPAGRCFGYLNVPIEDESEMGLQGRKKVVGVRLEIYPEEAAIVRLIFELYAEGRWDYGLIASHLNENHVPPPRKSSKDVPAWNHAAIRWRLENEKYIGRVVHGRTKTLRDPETRKTVHRKVAESEWRIFERPRLRIIGQELWDRVHVQMEAACVAAGNQRVEPTTRGPVGRTKVSRKYMFSGIMRCSICNGCMVMCDGPSGYYVCNTARRKAQYTCLTTGIKQRCPNRQKIRRESSAIDGFLII
jgi:site-specific DNA recombinase